MPNRLASQGHRPQMIKTMLAAGPFNLSFISFFARQDQIEDSMCDASSKVRDALSQPKIRTARSAIRFKMMTPSSEVLSKVSLSSSRSSASAARDPNIPYARSSASLS